MASDIHPIRAGQWDGERFNGWTWCAICCSWWPEGTAHADREEKRPTRAPYVA